MYNLKEKKALKIEPISFHELGMQESDIEEILRDNIDMIYAASYATIDIPDDLVKKVYSPYIEKYRSEFEFGELTSYEIGILYRFYSNFFRRHSCLVEFYKYF